MALTLPFRPARYSRAELSASDDPLPPWSKSAAASSQRMPVPCSSPDDCSLADALELASCCRARLAVERLREPGDELARPEPARPPPEPVRDALVRPEPVRPELDLLREAALARPPLRPAALFCAVDERPPDLPEDRPEDERLEVERPEPDLLPDLLAPERLELARLDVERPDVLLLRPVLADLRVVLRLLVLLLRPVLAVFRVPVLADFRAPVLDDLRAPVPDDLRAPVPDDLRAVVPEDLRALVPKDLRAPALADFRPPVADDLRVPVPEDFREAAVARPPRAPDAARFLVVESELLLFVDLRAPPLLRAPFRVVAMT